jgi:hypothetical protein
MIYQCLYKHLSMDGVKKKPSSAKKWLDSYYAATIV